MSCLQTLAIIMIIDEMHNYFFCHIQIIGFPIQLIYTSQQ